MATHFAPYPDDYFAEQASCGTWLGERSDTSANWAQVDCRLCLNRKSKIMAAHAAEEAAIVEQMGDMASHIRAAGEPK